MPWGVCGCQIIVICGWQSIFEVSGLMMMTMMNVEEYYVRLGLSCVVPPSMFRRWWSRFPIQQEKRRWRLYGMVWYGIIGYGLGWAGLGG